MFLLLSKVLIIILTAALFYPQLAQGDSDVPGRMNSFGLGPRVSYVQVRDDILVPLRFSGPGISLLLCYKREGLVDQHTVDAKLGLALLHDRYDFSGAMLSPSVNYRYLHSLASNILGGKISLGGQFSWSLDNSLYYDWDDEHIYWLTAIELGPVVSYSRPVKKNQYVHLTLCLPAIAMISRPPLYRYYKIDDLTKIGFFFSKPHEELHFAFYDTYQAAQVSLAYEKRRLSVKYTGGFAHATDPKPVILFTNSIDVMWKFGW